MSAEIQVGTKVKLSPSKPHHRDGYEVTVTRIYHTPSGWVIDYSDSRNGACRTVPTDRIKRVVK